MLDKPVGEEIHHEEERGQYIYTREQAREPGSCTKQALDNLRKYLWYLILEAMKSKEEKVGLYIKE